MASLRSGESWPLVVANLIDAIMEAAIRSERRRGIACPGCLFPIVPQGLELCNLSLRNLEHFAFRRVHSLSWTLAIFEGAGGSDVDPESGL